MKGLMIFGLFLATLGLYLGIHFFPTVKEIIDGVDTTGWNNPLLESYLGIMPIVFIVLIPVCAISIFILKKD